MIVFVDRLSVFSFARIFRYGLLRRLQLKERVEFQYLTATGIGKRLLGYVAPLRVISGTEADYAYTDILDKGGALAGTRAVNTDPLPICNQIRKDVFEKSRLVTKLSRRFDVDRLLLFLEKILSRDIEPVLLNINIVSWHRRTSIDDKDHRALFFVAESPFLDYLKTYASMKDVRLVGYRSLNFSSNHLWKKAAAAVISKSIRVLRNLFSRRGTNGIATPGAVRKQPSCTVAIPYTGHGLSLDSSKNTDLFWVDHAKLDPDQLLIYATRGDIPITRNEYELTRSASIRVVALNESARQTPGVPLWPAQSDMGGFLREGRSLSRQILSSLRNLIHPRKSERWTSSQLLRFLGIYIYWRRFFLAFQVKTHVDYQDWGHARVASDQAIADLGGISIAYQRSFEAFPSVRASSTVDVHFVSSHAWEETERQSRSLVSNLVSSGYAHDNVFEPAKKPAEELRRQLTELGAEFVVCFIDGGSFDDQRLGPSNEYRAEDYRFLCEALLADPTMGLVLKPKKPDTLRQRLGPIAANLEAALNTGRCHIYDESEGIVTSVLPAQASMSADVTVGLLYGSSAAYECALAGTPTLLLDRESILYHPLHELGDGTVVFNDWNTLWQAILEFRRDPVANSNIGNWSPTLESLDQFQDGQGPTRIGEYIGDLIDLLAQGKSREESLEAARQRYTGRWGYDKIVDLRTDPETVSPNGSAAEPIETRPKSPAI